MANGDGALESNTTGVQNTGIGEGALEFNSLASTTRPWAFAPASDITGDGNLCIGEQESPARLVSTTGPIFAMLTRRNKSPADGVAFVTVRLSDGRLGHQPKVMRSASSELQKTVDELQATVAQLTAAQGAGCTNPEGDRPA